MSSLLFFSYPIVAKAVSFTFRTHPEPYIFSPAHFYHPSPRLAFLLEYYSSSLTDLSGFALMSGQSVMIQTFWTLSCFSKPCTGVPSPCHDLVQSPPLCFFFLWPHLPQSILTLFFFCNTPGTFVLLCCNSNATFSRSAVHTHILSPLFFSP